MSESRDKKPAPEKAAAEKPPAEKAAAKGASKVVNSPAVKQPPAKTRPASPSAKPVANKKPQTDNSGSKAPLWLSLLSLAASIALGVAAFFFWQQQQQFLQGRDRVAGRVDSKLQEVDTTISRVKSSFDDLKSAAQKNRDVLSDKFSALQETQLNQDNRISTLNSLIGRSTQDWTLAEVEYLLRVASERVQLQRDTDTALLALENADRRLNELADPGLAGVRQQIASERDLLKRVPAIDREGMAGRFDALLAQLDSLPISGQTYQALAAEGEISDAKENQARLVELDWKSVDDWKKIPGIVGAALRKLVTIRANEQPVQPMIQPGSETFLRQNLRLQIEAARLALLREDPVFYQQAIKTATSWLSKYYAADDNAVQATREQLDELGSVQIRPEMPDISKSLRLLRKHQELTARVSNTADRPAAAAAPPAADAGQDDTTGQHP